MPSCEYKTSLRLISESPNGSPINPRWLPELQWEDDVLEEECFFFFNAALRRSSHSGQWKQLVEESAFSSLSFEGISFLSLMRSRCIHRPRLRLTLQQANTITFPCASFHVFVSLINLRIEGFDGLCARLHILSRSLHSSGRVLVLQGFK